MRAEENAVRQLGDAIGYGRDIEPAVVHLDVPIGSDVIIDAGDASDCARPFDPEDWGGADAEWAPCLPPDEGGRTR